MAHSRLLGAHIQRCVPTILHEIKGVPIDQELGNFLGPRVSRITTFRTWLKHQTVNLHNLRPTFFRPPLLVTDNYEAGKIRFIET